VDAKKKQEARELADFLATYHVLPGGGLTYEQFVGLYLNIHRVRFQRAAEVAYGYSAASSPRDLGPEWGDALGRDESEGDRIVDEANAARAVARAKAKIGWRD
jgi:hypothetical protein